MPSAAPLYGLVLAGGRSQRMTEDKGALTYAGIPQVTRAHALLERLCEKSFVSVNETQQHAETYRTLPKILDRLDDQGPAAGIWSAMESHPQAAWLVIGCDMPLIEIENLRALLDSRTRDAHVTCFAAADGCPEPLCAIYEPTSIEPLAKALKQGERGLRAIFGGLRVRVIQPESQDALANANTPEERSRIQDALSKRKTAPCG